MECMLEHLADKKVRDKVCEYIDMAQKADSDALELLEKCK